MIKTEERVNCLEEMSKFIFVSKYSRYNDKLQRRETWEEAVDRVCLMHTKKYSSLPKEDIEKIEWAFSLVKNKIILPSMRSMQFGGKAIEVKNERQYNCAVRHIDSIRSFAEVFFLLLCGCGVGIGLYKKYLSRLPDLVGPEDKTGAVITYSVEDTIEGWANAIEALLSCYCKNTSLTGRKIVFDYSKIRKKGELLKTGGGKAPGYKGLKNALSKIKDKLDHIIEYKNQNILKSIDAYDILMHCADAVLSGGVRRSATSTVFDKDDEDMIMAKTFHKVERVYSFDESVDENTGKKILEGKILFEGKKYEVSIQEWELDNLKKNNLINWWHLFPQRARSNNSVLLLRDRTSKEEFVQIVNRTKEFGEPGFVFSSHEDAIFNPCFEVGFIPVTEDGVCGVQFCNLTTINGSKIDTEERFKEAVEAETIIGTLQAGYTHFPFLSKAAEFLTKEEALLGCSITGMMDNPKVLLDKDLQKKMADYAKKINELWAKKININPAARITVVKPEGTASLILGTGSGIHPHHDRKYIRRVQNSKMDNVYKFFKKHNPHMCEHSVWSANHVDDVISFPVEVGNSAIIKKDISAIDHLKIIKSTQENWVKVGTSKYNKKNIEHNVSCTVVVKKDEWEDVIDYIYKNREFFCAISLLSETGDKDFPQAPMESIISDKDNETWSNLYINMKSINYEELKETEDKTTLLAESACSGGKCELV